MMLSFGLICFSLKGDGCEDDKTGFPGISSPSRNHPPISPASKLQDHSYRCFTSVDPDFPRQRFILRKFTRSSKHCTPRSWLRKCCCCFSGVTFLPCQWLPGTPIQHLLLGFLFCMFCALLGWNPSGSASLPALMECTWEVADDNSYVTRSRYQGEDPGGVLDTWVWFGPTLTVVNQ